MPLCTQCRTVSPEGSLLCTKCGASLSSTTPNVAPALNLEKTAPRALAQRTSPHEDGTPYKPDGGFDPLAPPALLFATIVGSIFVGYIYATVSSVFNIFILFPLLAGIGAGGFLYKVNDVLRVRSVPMAAIFGILAGLLTYGVAETVHARQLRGPMIQAMVENAVNTAAATTGVPATDPSLANVRATALTQAESYMTPWHTVATYEEARSITGRRIKSTTFAGKGYWFLFVLDLACVSIMGAAVSVSAAQRPYCPNCRKWHLSRDILKVHPAQNPEIAEKIRARDWPGLLNVDVGGTVDNKNSTTVSMSRCEGCGAGTLMVTSTNPNLGLGGRQHLTAESTQKLL